MFDDGVLGFCQDACQCVAVQRVEVGEDREASDDFRNESETLQVLRHDIAHEVFGVDFLGVLHGVVAHGVRVQSLCDFLFNAVEGASADEEDVLRVHVNVVLVGVFASAFGRYVDDGTFQEFQQALLHALSADVACDGWVVAFACDFVNFIDEDDASLGAFDVEVCHLEQSAEDAFDVFPDIACFGEDGGINDGEGHVEQAGDGSGEQCLSRSGRADHDDV